LTTIVPKELEGSNCHALIISRFIKGKFEPKYFSYYFNSNYGRKRLRDIEIGTTMKHLNVSDMRLWLVPYPPSKKEQTLIATALSDADAFITSLEKLIAKKRMIKQGAMQKLLAPKKGWVVKKLGEICQIFKGRSLSKSMLNENGKYECVLYGELFTTYKEVINEVVSHTNLLEGVPSKFGDILFPGSTTTTGIDLAKASALMKENVQLGGDVIIVRKKDFEYNPIFLSYFLNQERKQEIASTTKGITIHHLYGKDLFDIEVSFPQDKEQNHIATILGDMDLEIVGLEKKLEKQRMIKAGMMQQLLTGKIRIYGNN
jgi:type I restriction enzyme S subunit